MQEAPGEDQRSRKAVLAKLPATALRISSSCKACQPPQSPFHSAERGQESIQALRGSSASGQIVIGDRALANCDNDGLEAVGLPELAGVGPFRSVLVFGKRHG